MSYSVSRAAPSIEAHAAAAALDTIIESLLDGLQITDAFTVFASAPAFADYTFESGISKGESLSRIAQVLSLVDRDNDAIAGMIPEPWDVDDDESKE